MICWRDGERHIQLDHVQGLAWADALVRPTEWFYKATKQADVALPGQISQDRQGRCYHGGTTQHSAVRHPPRQGPSPNHFYSEYPTDGTTWRLGRIITITLFTILPSHTNSRYLGGLDVDGIGHVKQEYSNSREQRGFASTTARGPLPWSRDDAGGILLSLWSFRQD
jgi:hypothetical protein